MLESTGLVQRKYESDSIKNRDKNKLLHSDRQFHDWYRFVLSYPPQLVRDYLRRFNLSSKSLVLDPFCGTGTTIVEAKFSEIASIGLEANRFAQFASQTKVNWNVCPVELIETAQLISAKVISRLSEDAISDVGDNQDVNIFNLKRLDGDLNKLLLTNSISPLPLHKTLVLLEEIEEYKGRDIYAPLRLAVANVVVFKSSNLRFGPEVGVGKLKVDSPVIAPWLEQVSIMSRDLLSVEGQSFPPAKLIPIDSRSIVGNLKEKSIDAVITSPPYPNEKDYTRTTRLESVLLGLVTSKEDLRSMKKTLLRSNTRGVYKGDDDDIYVANIPEVQRLAREIEAERTRLGKTSGFERMYARVTQLYFGGMAKHLLDLQPYLKRGAYLGYVVGDQASYLKVMIRTGHVLGDVAKSIGYELEAIEPFRTRFSTATKSELNEEVVVLRWSGKKGK